MSGSGPLYGGIIQRAHLLRSGSIGATRGDTYCPVRGEILRPGQDELLRRHFSSVPSLIKNESVGIEDDQIPS